MKSNYCSAGADGAKACLTCSTRARLLTPNEVPRHQQRCWKPVWGWHWVHPCTAPARAAAPQPPGTVTPPKKPCWKAFASIANDPRSQMVPQTRSCSPGRFFVCLMDAWGLGSLRAGVALLEPQQGAEPRSASPGSVCLPRERVFLSPYQPRQLPCIWAAWGPRLGPACSPVQVGFTRARPITVITEEFIPHQLSLENNTLRTWEQEESTKPEQNLVTAALGSVLPLPTAPSASPSRHGCCAGAAFWWDSSNGEPLFELEQEMSFCLGKSLG